MVTGRAGKFCAGAGGTHAVDAIMAAKIAAKALHFMAFPSVSGRDSCSSPEDEGDKATPDHFLPQSQACVGAGIQSKPPR
jgi:hypothetical protein